MTIELNDEEAKMFKTILINQVRDGEYDWNIYVSDMIHKVINQLSNTEINTELLNETVKPIIGILSNWNDGHYLRWFVADDKSSDYRKYTDDEKDIKKCFEHGYLSTFYPYIEGVSLVEEDSDYAIKFSTKLHSIITIRVSKNEDSYYMIEDIKNVLN